MPAQEKIIKYRSLPVSLALMLCNLSMPAWALAPALWLFLLILIGFSKSITKDLTMGDFLSGLYSGILSVALLALGAIITGIFHDSNIVVASEGLTIPIFPSAGNHSGAAFWC